MSVKKEDDTKKGPLKLSHVGRDGRANMVDIGQKPVQKRIAIAEGRISLSEEALKQVEENLMKKGDVLSIAEIAGVQGAKKTSDLVPLCHPLSIDKIEVHAETEEKGVRVRSKAVSTGKTGVEMEALCAVQVALLTVYDMCKAVDKSMVISEVKLLEKVKEDL